MEGWVKLHRKLTEKAFYRKDSETVHLWIHLLLSVFYQIKNIRRITKVVPSNTASPVQSCGSEPEHDDTTAEESKY